MKPSKLVPKIKIFRVIEDAFSFISWIRSSTIIFSCLRARISVKINPAIIENKSSIESPTNTA
jgi:hypothetical protein